MPGKRAANQLEVRGHLAIAQSHPDLAEVVYAETSVRALGENYLRALGNTKT